MEQLQYMMEALGLPPKHMQKNSGRWEHFFEQSGAPKLVENTKGEVHYPGTKRLERLIGAKDASFVQFVERCLDWDPRTRMTPEEGLRHEWLLELGRTAVGLRDTHKSKHPIHIRRNLSKASP
jgi:dual specificity tyrosine-phosphorylation-regulated kinase 2/3/4